MDDLAGCFEIDAPAEIVAAKPDHRDEKTGFPEISLFHFLFRTGSGSEGREDLVQGCQLIAVDRVGDEHRRVETGGVPGRELVANL
jgi:hypothetical protein